jgi:pilus retraction protein PilT
MALEIIHRLIETALEHGASDLLISAGAHPRLKIAGTTHQLEAAVVRHEDMVDFWRACGADPVRDMDRDHGYMLREDVRLRVSLFKHLGRLGAALRPIKKHVPPLDTLGLPSEILIPWLERRSGLILFTGATGAGKSTTIASCLNHLNQTKQKHIISIEDPIEFFFKNDLCLFTQREVGTDTESFVRGLRGALRQAPDVLFIGEIRDPETATIALQACETGHLVFSSLHSSDCADTIERLINIFPPSDRESNLLLLSMQLIGIMSQMLLPAADGSGYVPVCEYMENSGAIRGWIRGERLNEVRDHMKRPQTPGCYSFLKALVTLCQQGRIDPAVASSAVNNPSDFDRAIRGLS